MKPKTKIQHAVVELSKRLPVLSQDEKEYAINKLFPKLAYATKSSGFCLECGQSIDIKKIVRKKVVCDHCGEILKVEVTRKRTLDMKHYRFSTSHLMKYDNYDFQVIRTYEFFSYHNKGKSKRTHFWEVCQNWYDKSGKDVTIASLVTWGGNFQGSMVLRNNTSGGYYHRSYDVASDLHTYCPELRSEYIQKGIDDKALSGSSLKILIQALNYSQVETTIKSGYLETYQYWGIDNVVKFFSTLKICIRNKYKIKDPTMYLDLLKALDKLGLDLHNAHYVCPKNVKKSHDHYIEIVKVKEEEERLIRQIQYAEEDKRKKAFNNTTFKKEKGKFFDLCFTKDNIEIRPLTSIEEFKIEGNELNHCVGGINYYTQLDSLVLSAKVDGKRTETIQIGLQNFKIIQCRGYGNKPSKFHDEIMKLMQSKIKFIRQKATQKEKPKAKVKQLQSA